MKSMTQKQQEWNEQAVSTDSLDAQVCRPINKKSHSSLITNIKQNLKLEQEFYSLLDVGCGNALILSSIKNDCRNIYGVDYSSNMIKKAKGLIPKGNFQTSEANSLNFEDQFFDRILCYSIFHYFKNEDYVLTVIDELMRVCQKGGIILIGDLLDNQFEQEIKSSSDMEHEEKIPLIQRYSEWYFCDLKKIQKYIISKGAIKAEILAQPKTFQCYKYRKDIQIWL